MIGVSSNGCVSCGSPLAPLEQERVDQWLAELEGWSIDDRRRLTKTYEFPDFRKALAFVNRIGLIADDQDQHPEINFSWHRVTVTTWTREVGGLTDGDFTLAVKIDNTRRDGLKKPPARSGGT